MKGQALRNCGEFFGRLLLGLLFVLEACNKLGAYNGAASYMSHDVATRLGHERAFVLWSAQAHLRKPRMLPANAFCLWTDRSRKSERVAAKKWMSKSARPSVGAIAFTDRGLENLSELIAEHKGWKPNRPRS